MKQEYQVLPRIPEDVRLIADRHRDTRFAATKFASKEAVLQRREELREKHMKMRHGGFGKLILQKAVQTAREEGFSRINIGIVEESEVLKSWCIKNGFVHDGTRKFDHLPFTVGFMHLMV